VPDEDRKKRIKAEYLRSFSYEVLREVGVREKEANIVADVLVATDLWGVDSHGIAHLERYVERIGDGEINLEPTITMETKSPTTAVMDGDNGFGFVAGVKSMKQAMEMATEYGSGFVSVRNSTHFGAAFYYAMMPLEKDMIGISLTVGGRCMKAPLSKGQAGGLNPIAVAVPAEKKHPFVIDMSTSVVAGGQVEIAKRRGNQIPEGWVVDEEGNPITDPDRINCGDPDWEGGFLPLGGSPETGAFKGFGLSVLVNLLCTTLSGATPGTSANHFFGAFKVDGFRPAGEFKRSVDELIESIESLPSMEEENRLFAPGGLEAQIKKERKTEGVPLDDKVYDSLMTLSKRTDVPLEDQI